MPFSNPFLSPATYVRIAPFAQVTIATHQTEAAANLWNDIDRLDPVTGNVILTDVDGFFQVYVDQGRYNISILSGWNRMTTFYCGHY